MTQKEPMQTVSTVIFDIMGVLFKVNILPVISNLGFWNVARHLIKHRKSPITSGLELLDFVRRTYPNEFQDSISYRGFYLPKFLCEWQAGAVTGGDTGKRIEIMINELDAQNYFKNSTERTLMHRLVQTFISATHGARALKPLKPMHTLVRDLHASKKYKLLILSNIDEQTLVILQGQYPALFECFEGIVTSYKTKKLKPHAEIFTHLTDQYEVATQECFFIDDQPDNTRTAHQLGMQTITCIKVREAARVARKRLL